MPDVSFHDICKSFSTTQALWQLNITCKKGEVHALLGENGAGKSTLAGLLAGFYLPTSGQIRIDNKAVELNSPQKSLQCGIGVVFQHPLLVPELSVMENLLLGNAWWQLLNIKKSLPKYKAISNILGINIDAKKLVKHLSLAEQQYIEIMRALWREQKIIVFDEATALLSPQEAQHLGTIMQALAKKDHTIIYITHKLHEATVFANRMTILRQGKKVAEISARDIFQAKESNNIQELERMICNFLFAEKQRTNFKHQNVFAQNQHLKDVVHKDNVSVNSLKINTKLLEVTSISSHEEEQICSINNISFQINAGEILGIGGIDGHGQKHLAEVLAGQRLVKSGAILLHGQDISALNNAKRQQIGIHYVSEDRLHEALVGTEQIALNLQIKNIGLKPFWKFGIAKWKLIQNHAKNIMQSLFIPQKHQASLTQNLSGGTIQKIILARDLNQPNLCVGILHHPTHGLDAKTAQEIHEKLRAKLEQNCSFILLSSDIDELLSLSTHLAVMKNGSLSPCFPNNNDAHQQLTTLISMH